MATPPARAGLLRRAARPALAGAAALTIASAGLVALSSPARAADTATIDGGTTFQTIAGFGASEGFGRPRPSSRRSTSCTARRAARA
jgi:hypothetical protein